MKIQDILSELEKDKLAFIAGDPVMLEAVKKVVLNSVYFDGTLHKKGVPDVLKNFALALASRPGVTNEDLGAELKASLAGVQLLEQGFMELEKFKKVESKLKETKNQARRKKQ